MERIRIPLETYIRFRQLTAQLPQLEEQLKKEKYRAREAGLAAAGAKWELDRAEKGSFFQRILGKQEEEKEKAWKEYRRTQTEVAAAKQSMQTLEQQLEEARQEWKACCGSWEEYLLAKEGYIASGGDAAMLWKMEKPILIRVLLQELGWCLSNLEEARCWMQEDVRRPYVREENRKLEFLGNARENAGYIRQMLTQFSDGCMEIPAYLNNPDGYILGVTMAYRQLDRLNFAQEQLRRLRRRLQDI